MSEPENDIMLFDPMNAMEQATKPDALQVMAAQMERSTQLMRVMADTIRASSEEIAELRQLIEQMATLTPSQEAKLNAEIRDKALRLAEKRHIFGDRRAVNAIGSAIRRDLRGIAGVRAIREIPRCRYQGYLRYVAGWDDPKAVREGCAKSFGGAT